MGLPMEGNRPTGSASLEPTEAPRKNLRRNLFGPPVRRCSLHQMPSNATTSHADAASEARLLTAFTGDGESGAFTAVVQSYYGLVQGTARRILRENEAARDVAQEVFVHFARDARRVRPDAIGAWLHRAAV